MSTRLCPPFSLAAAGLGEVDRPALEEVASRPFISRVWLGGPRGNSFIIHFGEYVAFSWWVPSPGCCRCPSTPLCAHESLAQVGAARLPPIGGHRLPL